MYSIRPIKKHWHLGTSEPKNIMTRVNSETLGLLNALRQKMTGLKLEVMSLFKIDIHL